MAHLCELLHVSFGRSGRDVARVHGKPRLRTKRWAFKQRSLMKGIAVSKFVYFLRSGYTLTSQHRVLIGRILGRHKRVAAIVSTPSVPQIGANNIVVCSWCKCSSGVRVWPEPIGNALGHLCSSVTSWCLLAPPTGVTSHLGTAQQQRTPCEPTLMCERHPPTRHYRFHTLCAHMQGHRLFCISTLVFQAFW